MIKIKTWIVKNEAGQEEAEILVYGDIVSEESYWATSAGANELANSLMVLNNKPVNVRINSFGGSVFAGHAMMNALKNYKGKVTAFIDGIAASAATLVALGADKIIMPVNSMMMIHNPAFGLSGTYEKQDLDRLSESLEEVKKSVISAYRTKTVLSEEDLAKLMDEETWMTAQKAKEYGFADEIKGEIQLAIQNNAMISNGIVMSLDTAPAKIQLVNVLGNQNKGREEGKSMSENVDPIENIIKKVENYFNKYKEVNKVGNNATLEITVDLVKNQFPSIYNQILDEGKQLERTRLEEIDKIANDLPKEFVNEVKYIECSNAQQLALKVLQNGGQALNNMKDDVKKSGAGDVTASTDVGVIDEEAERSELVNMMAETFMKSGGKNNG